MGLILGPSTYSLKKAQLDHSPTGSEKVFWRLSEADFIQKDDPSFIAILQMPKTVDRLEISAALQAYHSFSLTAASLAEAIQYFRQQLASFFRKGAPLRDTKVWDVTSSL